MARTGVLRIGESVHYVAKLTADGLDLPDDTPLYAAVPASEPLSEQAIMECWEGCSDPSEAEVSIIALARAIERAHGIGANGGKPAGATGAGEGEKE